MNDLLRAIREGNRRAKVEHARRTGRLTYLYMGGGTAFWVWASLDHLIRRMQSELLVGPLVGNVTGRITYVNPRQMVLMEGRRW